MAFRKWSDVRGDHIERIGIERAEELTARLSLRLQMQALVDVRKRRNLTQGDVAETMGVTVGRVSQIESGEVAGIDVLERYVSALGGDLQLTAIFPASR